MLALKMLAKLLGILNKNASPRAIAAAMAIGSILGITPVINLHNLLVVFLILFLNVNITAAIFSWGFFELFSFVFDPLFNKIGYFLLVEVDALKPLWTAMYNTPIVPWTRFNNTLVLGSLVFALLFMIPFYVLVVWGVKKYRERVLVWVTKLRIYQILKGTMFYDLYQKFS